MAAIIVLNGVSSAGKTTLAREVQRQAPEACLIAAMDDFLGMVPDGLEFGDDWFPVQRIRGNSGQLPRITNGPSGAILLAEMRAFVGRIAQRGISVIVDEVCQADEIREYRSHAGLERMIIVKVDAPLPVLEQRELARGDRLIGLARDQSTFLHNGIDYDIEVDTDRFAPDANARLIIAAAFG